jgi:hypothetical protein
MCIKIRCWWQMTVLCILKLLLYCEKLWHLVGIYLANSFSFVFNPIFASSHNCMSVLASYSIKMYFLPRERKNCVSFMVSAFTSQSVTLPSIKLSLYYPLDMTKKCSVHGKMCHLCSNKICHTSAKKYKVRKLKIIFSLSPIHEWWNKTPDRSFNQSIPYSCVKSAIDRLIVTDTYFPSLSISAFVLPYTPFLPSCPVTVFLFILFPSLFFHLCFYNSIFLCTSVLFLILFKFSYNLFVTLYTANEGPVRIQYKYLVPIYVFP